MNLNLELKGQGYPILCLHGHPGSSRTMSVFTDYLCQKYRTLTPDLRGYGQSRPQGNFTMTTHLDELQSLLDRHQIEHCLLLGWSLGGILALELALANPQRFTGLILVAAAARPRSSHPKVTLSDLAYTGLAGMINYVNPGWSWNINYLGKRSLFRYLLSQHTPQAYNYLAKEGVPAYWQTSRAAHRALAEAISSGYSCLATLPKITVPCLILAGESDRHITAAASAETAQMLSHSEFICYPNTAHLFPWEIPNKVRQDISLWLERTFNASLTD
ncbi:MAG TPA: alpha/beta fold hydrolase [Xenococcaceae cyanobacterium]